MTGIALGLLLQTVLAADASAGYATAYEQCQVNGRPLVVLVSADWCPHCVTLKQRVLPALARRGVLKDLNFAIVNPDHDADLAGRLMQGNTIPQLIVFSRTDEGWRREQVTGASNEGAVQALLQRAATAN